MMGVAIGHSFDVLALVRQPQPPEGFELTSISIVLCVPMRLNPMYNHSGFSVDRGPFRADFGGASK